MLGSITLISYHEARRDDLYMQLSDLVGDQLYINSYVYYQLKPGQNYSDDLVVITAPLVKDEIIPCLDPSTPYIIARRTVKMDKINLLLDIPAGSQVLVVYNLFEGAVDLINDLQNMGLTDFYMHPYDNNKPLDREYKYAITLGEPNLVPAGIPNIIDLGMRNLSPSTIGEILSYFHAGNIIDEIVLDRYIKTLIRTSMDLCKEVKRSTLLQKQMEALIADIEDGVIVFDRNYNITTYNETAFNLLKGDISEKKLKTLLTDQWDWNNPTSYFTQINLSPHYIILKPLYTPDSTTMMMTIRDVKAYFPKDEEGKTQKYKSKGLVKYSFKDIIFSSDSMKRLMSKAVRMAQSDSPILIQGESGSGKELLAQAIHTASPRSNNPFVVINCGSFSESLLESELFGYEEGAFTGARKCGKPGLLETANTGTFFLDEIGDAPPSLQKRLLRVIQEKEVLRISGIKPILIDVRIIAATHQDLSKLVSEGRFRKDLFYRLNVLTIQLPPLRNRQEDISLIFQALLIKHLSTYHTPIPKISSRTLKLLESYSWPGNIRELENLAEYLANGIVFDNSFKPEDELLEWISARQQLKLSCSNEFHLENSQLGSTFPQLNQDTKCILEALFFLERDGRPPGRKDILGYCQEKGFDLSDQQIKLRLRRLQELNLIVSQKGCGSKLTETGLYTLKN